MPTPNEIDGASLYDCAEDQEHITHQHPDDAIERYVAAGEPDEPIQQGEAVTLYGFAPAPKPSVADVVEWSGPLRHLIESLDDDHELGGDDAQEVSDGMREAERTFVEAVLADYTVRRCEVVGRKEIDLHAWCKVHYPDAIAKPEGTD